MKLETIIPLPPEDYVYNTGLIVYSIGYLEWQLLGDLCGKNDIPNEYKIENLSKKPTGAIANLFTDENLLNQVLDTNLKSRIRQFGEKLKSIVEKRNHIIHAHPATIEGEQRFFRWTPSHQIEINECYLKEIINEIELLLRQDTAFRN